MPHRELVLLRKTSHGRPVVNGELLILDLLRHLGQHLELFEQVLLNQNVLELVQTVIEVVSNDFRCFVARLLKIVRL